MEVGGRVTHVAEAVARESEEIGSNLVDVVPGAREWVLGGNLVEVELRRECTVIVRVHVLELGASLYFVLSSYHREVKQLLPHIGNEGVTAGARVRVKVVEVE